MYFLDTTCIWTISDAIADATTLSVLTRTELERNKRATRHGESRGIESKREQLRELKEEQRRAARAKKQLQEIAASERHALALAQFLHVVLCKELEENVDQLIKEFRAAKQRLKETNKAINPFVRKKTTLRRTLTRLKKGKCFLTKKRHQHLMEVKTAEAKVEGFDHKLDEELNNIDICKSQCLCCRPRHIRNAR